MEQREKNKEIELYIDDTGVNGEGIGRADGYVFFVNGAVPGDRVKAKILKVKKNYGYAKLISIISPSEYRVKPVCENADKCGGCTLQHMAYGRQLRFKEGKVRDCLIRIGGMDKERMGRVMEPIAGMDDPFHYRNKAQFPVGRGADGEISIGFFAGGTHDIVDTDECHIQSPVATRVTAVMREWIKESKNKPYDEKSHTGDIRHIVIRNSRDMREIMVCVVVTRRDIKGLDLLVEKLSRFRGVVSICLNINSEKTNRIMGSETVCIHGKPYIEDVMRDMRYMISPLSFYQVNPVQTEKLYDTVLEYASLTGNETVWDLYCGIGTMSLPLAREAKAVMGAEIVPQAVEDAKGNARLNNIYNAVFLCGDADEVAHMVRTEKKYAYVSKPDIIVADPPRKGCGSELLEMMIDISPEKIIYVSCDPATLARDVKILAGGGYEVRKARPVDMFPWTVHVETVVLMSRVRD